MTSERDPGLQALFDSARRVAADDVFVADVMARIESSRRATLIGWVLFGLLTLPAAWWLSGPLLDTLNVVAGLLPDSLIAVEQDWLAQLLAPLNSGTGIAGLLFLGAWMAFRKLFR